MDTQTREALFLTALRSSLETFYEFGCSPNAAHQVYGYLVGFLEVYDFLVPLVRDTLPPPLSEALSDCQEAAQ